MKNETVAPAGANGEAKRRSRYVHVAMRVALACAGALGCAPPG
ncbi:hypothetical protein [Burkholderia sp. BE12]|nr:hypothetical protein [Burkholderia sp. BE12]